MQAAQAGTEFTHFSSTDSPVWGLTRAARGNVREQGESMRYLLMKTRLLALALAFPLIAGSTLFAASAKTYQVTGPIVSLTDTTLVIQKGDEQWEVARDSNTKSDSELKVGEKATVHYRMTATAIDVKTTGTLSQPGDSAETKASKKAKAGPANASSATDSDTKK